MQAKNPRAIITIKQADFFTVEHATFSANDEDFIDGLLVPQWELSSSPDSGSSHTAYAVKIKQAQEGNPQKIIAYIKPVCQYNTQDFETIFGFEFDSPDFNTEKIIAVKQVDCQHRRRKKDIVLTKVQ